MSQFVVLTTNQCGVLARITAAISSTGANIRRCQVSEMPDASTSLVTLDVQASEPQSAAINRKLIRLVEVIDVQCHLHGAGEDSQIASFLRAQIQCQAVA